MIIAFINGYVRNLKEGRCHFTDKQQRGKGGEPCIDATFRRANISITYQNHEYPWETRVSCYKISL